MAALLLAYTTACTHPIDTDVDSNNQDNAKSDDGSLQMSDDPHYNLLKNYKNLHALELMKTYGAHSIGIQRKPQDALNAGQLVLALYIDNSTTAFTTDIAQSVPPLIDVSEAGSDPVMVPTEIIYSSQASPEQ